MEREKKLEKFVLESVLKKLEPKTQSRTLFAKEDAEAYKLETEIPSHNSFIKSRTDPGDRCKTPPMEKRSAAVPMAPKKQNKFNRASVKPKKLVYTDEEQSSPILNESETNVHSSAQNSSKRVLRNNVRTQTAQLRGTAPVLKAQSRNDKENVPARSVQKSKCKTSDKTSVASSSTKQEVPKKKDFSYKGFNSDTSKLSLCDKDATWEECLYWLQPRRDVGMWVQCCRKQCKKWRYVEEYHDPTDVPSMWFCYMNSDKAAASCTVPEKPIPSEVDNDLIENRYNAGSIVWAHVQGFPWWPAMVDDSPETLSYYKLAENSVVPYEYHVTFFSESKLQDAWVSPKSLKPFVKAKRHVYPRQTSSRKIDKTQLEKARELARSAIHMSILDRLKKFSFIVQYNKQLNRDTGYESFDWNNNIASDSSDDVIPCSPEVLSHVTLKEFCTQLPQKRRNT